MFRFRSLATGVALVALLATSVAFAQGPRGAGSDEGGDWAGWAGPRAQRAESDRRAARAGSRDQRSLSASRPDAFTASRRLAAKQRQAIETLPVNETLITSATQDMTQAQVDVAIQEARLNADIWSVLTPEQQARRRNSARSEKRGWSSGGRRSSSGEVTR